MDDSSSLTCHAVPCVIQALLTPLGYQLSDVGLPMAPPSGTQDAANGPQSEKGGTNGSSQPLDMLAFIIRNPGGKFQPELIANTCALLAGVSSGPPTDVEKIKLRLRAPIEALATTKEDTPTSSKLTSSAAKKVLDVWK